MGYRIGNFYCRRADDWHGYNVYQDGVEDPVSWFESSGAAAGECNLRYAKALEKECDALKLQNTRLSNQVDDLQHDIGVLNFHGSFLDKAALESLRTDALADVVVILQNNRAQIYELQNQVRRAVGMLASGIDLQPAPIVVTGTPEIIEALKQALAKEKPPQRTEVLPYTGDQAELDRLRRWFVKIQQFAATFVPSKDNSQAVVEMIADALAGKAP